ncbi:MAG: hypothetical protein ICV60_24260, partial [Pyrinomonadaceae bacterium]|nr:hypothetical protein [Pyrinomonadaceae bacterium]
VSRARLTRTLFALFICALALLYTQPLSSSAQQKDKKGAEPPQASAQSLTRSTARHETRRFGYGGTVTLIGAPNGSVTIEAWPRNEVDITADIELRGGTEEELAQLATVNGFALDEEVNHLRILTTGTHDKAFMKRAAKNFPKKLMGLPWKIDYRLRVPAFTDLEVNMGSGAFTLNGVEGTIRIQAVESKADLTLAGGFVQATIERGSVNVRMSSRSWRGAGADIRLAYGDMNLELPPAASLDINADILRSGQIESSYTGLEPRDRTTFSPRSIRARIGTGGPTLAFTVADGTLRIKQRTEGGQ